jgi:hypothetical protein
MTRVMSIIALYFISMQALAETRVDIKPAPKKETPVLCVLPESGRFVTTEEGIAFILNDCDPRVPPHLWRPKREIKKTLI